MTEAIEKDTTEIDAAGLDPAALGPAVFGSGGSEPGGSDLGVIDQTVDPLRVDLTEAAADLLRSLTRRHGPLMFHQSGGCCDGSSPMCFPDGEFITGDADIKLGDLRVADLDQAVPFWMSRSQYEYWKHTHLTVDVVKGRGSGFSVEAPEGVRFMIRSRLLTDDEMRFFGLL